MFSVKDHLQTEAEIDHKLFKRVVARKYSPLHTMSKKIKKSVKIIIKFLGG